MYSYVQFYNFIKVQNVIYLLYVLVSKDFLVIDFQII